MLDTLNESQPFRPDTEDELPYTAYGPPPPADTEIPVSTTPAATEVTAASPSHQYIWESLSGIRSQQAEANKRGEESRSYRKGKGKGPKGKYKGGKGKPPHVYIGTDTECSICHHEPVSYTHLTLPTICSV